MTHRRVAAPLIAALCFAASIARAASPTPPVQTLAQALALATPPQSELYIAVDADTIALPNDAPTLFDGESATQMAEAYGQKVAAFGDVEAIAPRTIMVVNIPPGKPNVYDGMEPKQIVKLLAASFSKEQWEAFLGKEGIAYASLQPGDQRSLFEALFPDGKMTAMRFSDDTDFDSSMELGADQLRGARLRIAFRTSIALAVPGQPGSHVFSNPYFPPGSLGYYYMSNSPTLNADREFGAWVRQTVPNTLKSSDLSSDDPAWKTLVSPANMHTVDEAARAIGAATGREVYADPRYGKRTISMSGPGTPRRTYDVMRALALCVGGAWRGVGPATVLTNDRVGLAVKQELWRAFEDKAAALAPAGKELEPVAQPEGAAFTVKDIPFTGDDFPFSDKERETLWKQLEGKDTRSVSQSNIMHLELPLQDLTPAQQDAARHIQEQNAKNHTSSTLDGNVMLQVEPMVQIIEASLPAPVIISSNCDMLLPYPPMSAEQIAKFDTEIAESDAAKAGPPLPDSPTTGAELRAKIRNFTRRAALAEAATSEEIDTNIAAMKSLGLTELWLRVPLDAMENDDSVIALLSHAAKSAQAAHIGLYPAFRLLNWGDKAEDDLLDRTVLGETSKTVTPFAPKTASRMAALIGQAARIPGVQGMLWTDITPPGYAAGRLRSGEAPLGYATAGRLASLRASHADPSDLRDFHGSGLRAHVGLPGFGDGRESGQLYDDWVKLRLTTQRAFVSALASALPASYAPGPHAAPILTPPADGDDFQLFGSWDDLTHPQPPVAFIPMPGADGKLRTDGSETITMASARIYNTVPLSALNDTTPAEILRDTDHLIQGWIESKSHNIVFDAADARMLPRLADAVQNAK